MAPLKDTRHNNPPRQSSAFAEELRATSTDDLRLRLNQSINQEGDAHVTAFLQELRRHQLVLLAELTYDDRQRFIDLHKDILVRLNPDADPAVFAAIFTLDAADYTALTQKPGPEARTWLRAHMHRNSSTRDDDMLGLNMLASLAHEHQQSRTSGAGGAARR